MKKGGWGRGGGIKSCLFSKITHCDLQKSIFYYMLLCPMKIINTICRSVHLSNYWKCKNNYLFFQLRTCFHPYKICDVMQTRFATKPSYHLIWERLQRRKDSWFLITKHLGTVCSMHCQSNWKVLKESKSHTKNLEALWSSFSERTLIW